MEKKVSVIIPVYNSEKYIKECIESVINQTYQNLEIIVIDDCSMDSSIELVKNIKDDRINIISLPENIGVSNARNKGIEVATGDYICFIDSDDIWMREKIEKQVEFIEKNGYEFIYSNYAFLRGGNIDLKKCKKTHVPKSLTYNQALKNTTIFVSTVMINMKKINKDDICMPIMQIGQDTATWWNLLKKGLVAYGMDEVFAYYRVRSNSLASNKFRAVIGAWKLYSMQEIGFFKRIFCFNCYLFNAIKRRI